MPMLLCQVMVSGMLLVTVSVVLSCQSASLSMFIMPVVLVSYLRQSLFMDTTPAKLLHWYMRGAVARTCSWLHCLCC